MADHADDAAAFAERMVNLIDTSKKTTSYKLAVLTAIIDLVVAGTGPDGRPPQVLRGRDVARRVLELYWPQSRPFPGGGNLTQGMRGDLADKLAAFRRQHGLPEHFSLDEARRRVGDEAFRAVELEFVYTVLRFPLVRLQQVPYGPATREERFLYEYGWSEGTVTRERAARLLEDSAAATDQALPPAPGAGSRRAVLDDRMFLQPGVPEHLLRLEGLLRPFIQMAWRDFVARRNRARIPEAQLEEFLFGVDRTALHRIRGPLLDLQRGRCFYCRRGLGSRTAQVDHFLPWSRFPDDGIANLVVADAGCNSSKGAALAATHYLEPWWARLRTPSDLAAIAEAAGWSQGFDTTAGAARALYLWQPAGTLLWAGRDGVVERLDPDRVRRILLDLDTGRLAAEPPTGYD